MAQISKKRQAEISQDQHTIQRLYDHACQQWGVDKVQTDLTRIWDLRCIWGMKRVLPFGSMSCRNLGEVLWVARNVCGLGEE